MQKTIYHVQSQKLQPSLYYYHLSQIPSSIPVIANKQKFEADKVVSIV